MARPRVAVATSGGRDSTALLHCTLRQAAALGVDVVALHVHHGLMPQADDWLLQVQRQSRRWGATFACRRLDGRPARGQSIEAWARIERYRALAGMAAEAGCALVLLAHHRRDQAETWLLQALRGAGAAGLASMPAVARRGGITWARPWLDEPAEAIAAYARRHRLRHAEDPSNADPRFARSRLRHAVWPALTAAFGDAETAFAAAAARAREALALAREVADADLLPLVGERGLHVAPWRLLPPARRHNALRQWLAAATGAPPPQSLLDRLGLELPPASQGSWPAAGATLRLYRGWLSPQAVDAAAPTLAAPAAVLDLSVPGRVDVPGWPGHWQVQSTREGGLARASLRQVVAHARAGGERFRLAPGAAARSLKLQYQARGVPAWQRQGPLLSTAAGQLLFVPGLGPEAAFLAAAGVAQLQLRWVPDTAPATGLRQRGG